MLSVICFCVLVYVCLCNIRKIFMIFRGFFFVRDYILILSFIGMMVYFMMGFLVGVMGYILLKIMVVS